MTTHIIVTGTDTGIGKTIFSAGLAQLLDGYYFKPIQAGLVGETDSEVVQRLSALPATRILAERYRLNSPASPHLAAERDGIVIDPKALAAPILDRPIIIEGAGGLLVPVTREVLYIDVFESWRAPLVLCARTALGTLNHTLLSLEALRRRRISVLGVALIGEAHADNERTLGELGKVPILGRLPMLDPLSPQSLAMAFSAFSRKSFLGSAPSVTTAP
jgi:dethiobiotin synthetase